MERRVAACDTTSFQVPDVFTKRKHIGEVVLVYLSMKNIFIETLLFISHHNNDQSMR